MIAQPEVLQDGGSQKITTHKTGQRVHVKVYGGKDQNGDVGRET